MNGRMPVVAPYRGSGCIAQAWLAPLTSFLNVAMIASEEVAKLCRGVFRERASVSVSSSAIALRTSGSATSQLSVMESSLNAEDAAVYVNAMAAYPGPGLRSRELRQRTG